MRFATARLATGPKIHYAEHGDEGGRPVLLLHGWPDSWFSWSRVMPLLPPHLRALALDQRGFGDSDRPAGGYSIEDLALDVVAFLDASSVGGIGAPTLLLWGDRDALFARADQDRLAAAIPRARLLVYPETGHCPNWERPERVAADLGAFLEQG